MILELNPLKWGQKPTSSIPAYDHAAQLAALPRNFPPQPHIPSSTVRINQAAQEMHMSFLSAAGKDFKAVFGWLESSKGQTVVAGVEGTAIAVGTAFGAGVVVSAGVALLNKWMGEAIKVETLAAAAGAQVGSGATKSAAVLSTMVPELTAFLQSQGYTTAQVTAQANTINDALVTALNALGAPASTPTPAAPAAPVAA